MRTAATPGIKPALLEPVAEPEVGEARTLDISWTELPRQPKRLWVVGVCGLALAFTKGVAEVFS